MKINSAVRKSLPNPRILPKSQVMAVMPSGGTVNHELPQDSSIMAVMPSGRTVNHELPPDSSIMAVNLLKGPYTTSYHQIPRVMAMNLPEIPRFMAKMPSRAAIAVGQVLP